jgi:hypothetical protein
MTENRHPRDSPAFRGMKGIVVHKDEKHQRTKLRKNDAVARKYFVAGSAISSVQLP